MHIALFSNSFIDWTLDQILDWLPGGAPEVTAIELGAGGYERRRHCDIQALLRDPKDARALKDRIADCGLDHCALNVSGNPLHPDQKIASIHDADLRGAIELAAALGVKRIVAMSGCPGPGPGSSQAPHFVGGGWLPDLEGILAWQWHERILPYWRSVAADMHRADPELRICLELHPGTTVHNLERFNLLSAQVPNVLVNLDPSHFFWQEADPLVIIGHLENRIGFAHGKDTLIQEGPRSRNGILDARIPSADPRDLPWVFSTPGDAHDVGWWTRFVQSLLDSGYDGPISIEYEDPYRSPEDGVAATARTLAAAISGSSVPQAPTR